MTTYARKPGCWRGEKASARGNGAAAGTIINPHRFRLQLKRQVEDAMDPRKAPSAVRVFSADERKRYEAELLARSKK